MLLLNFDLLIAWLRQARGALNKGGQFLAFLLAMSPVDD